VPSILNVSQPYYSKIEDGSKKLSNANAEKLAEFYGVSKDVFLNDKQPVINHNIGVHSKIINNTEHYN
jgi:transcriptional regulator with XRE-family HTH domain